MTVINGYKYSKNWESGHVGCIRKRIEPPHPEYEWVDGVVVNRSILFRGDSEVGRVVVEVEKVHGYLTHSQFTGIGLFHSLDEAKETVEQLARLFHEKG